MKTQITKIVENAIKENSPAGKAADEIMELIFQGKENYFTMSPAIFKKIKTDGGHLYCFWNNIIEDWEHNWAFVPNLIK